MTKLKRVPAILAAVTLSAGIIFSPLTAEAASAETKVLTKSGNLNAAKPDIATVMAASKAAFTDNDAEMYLATPSTSSPYSAGQSNPARMNEGLEYINMVRLQAGLNSVVLNDEYNKQSQQGAVILAANGYLSHHPTKPSDMSNEFFEVGYEGTSSGNIAAGYQTFINAQEGFMNDSGASNAAALGHRRWLLNPDLYEIGMGAAPAGKGRYAGNYFVTRVFDWSGEDIDYDFVSWPASGYFAREFLDSSVSWSVSLNPEKYASPTRDNIKITVINSAGNIWYFDKNSNDDPGRGYGDTAFMTVNHTGYGIGNCIIFNFGIGDDKFYNGDYHVTIDGLTDLSGSPVQLSYEVNFVDSNNPSNTQTRATDPNVSTFPAGLYALGDGTWRYIVDGVLQSDYTGLVADANVGWWYVNGGAIDFNYNGIAANDYGKWLITGGTINFAYTGLYYDQTIGWCYIIGGRLAEDYTGLAANELGWWYVKNGILDFSYTGLAANEFGWWYVSGGTIDFSYTGLAQNDYGWWAVTGGTIAFGYTGLWYDPIVGWWYVENGAINFGYTGQASNEFGSFYVENGAVR